VGIIIISLYINYVYSSQTDETKTKLLEEISKILAHPFLLLVVGAVITSILIPTFTQRSQDRKKRRELQLDLANRISEVSTLSIACAIDIAVGKDERSQEAECMLKAKSIDVYLWTYFPDSNIADEWSKYNNSFAVFWTLTRHLWNNEFGIDKESIEVMKEYFTIKVLDTQLNWGKLETKDYRNDWDALKRLLLNEYRYFVVEVVQTPIKIF